MKFCIVLFGYMIAGCSTNLGEAKKDMAVCQIDRIKSKIDGRQENSFLRYCMEAKGYQFDESCTPGFFFPEKPECYKPGF